MTRLYNSNAVLKLMERTFQIIVEPTHQTIVIPIHDLPVKGPFSISYTSNNIYLSARKPDTVKKMTAEQISDENPKCPDHPIQVM
jgi:hypothetical protein